jgi:hypothetical protein
MEKKPTTKKEIREKSLAKALRENLLKRKQQKVSRLSKDDQKES